MEKEEEEEEHKKMKIREEYTFADIQRIYDGVEFTRIDRTRYVDATHEISFYHHVPFKVTCFHCSKDFIENDNRVLLNCKCIVCYGCLLKERMLNKACFNCGGTTNRALYKGELIDWTIHRDTRYLPRGGKTECAAAICSAVQIRLLTDLPPIPRHGVIPTATLLQLPVLDPKQHDTDDILDD